MPTISMFYGIIVALMYEDNDRHRKRSDPLLAALASVAQATDSLAPSPLAGEGWGDGV